MLVYLAPEHGTSSLPSLHTLSEPVVPAEDEQAKHVWPAQGITLLVWMAIPVQASILVVRGDHLKGQTSNLFEQLDLSVYLEATAYGTRTPQCWASILAYELGSTLPWDEMGLSACPAIEKWA